MRLVDDFLAGEGVGGLLKRGLLVVFLTRVVFLLEFLTGLAGLEWVTTDSNLDERLAGDLFVSFRGDLPRRFVV